MAAMHKTFGFVVATYFCTVWLCVVNSCELALYSGVETVAAVVALAATLLGLQINIHNLL